MSCSKATRSIRNIKELKKVLLGWTTKTILKDLNHYFILKRPKLPKADVKNVVRISVKKGEMTMYMIQKNKFSQLNEKRFYFSNGIICLPFEHFLLDEVDNYKKEKGQRIEKYFWNEKENLLELENAALKNSERLNFVNGILIQVPKIVDLSHKNVNRSTKFL